MRIKYADYPNLKVLKEKKFVNKYFDNEDFKGNICLLEAIQVEKELFIMQDEKKIVVLDNNFKWLQFYPENNKNIAISTAINDKNEIVEWYFDIAKDSSKNKDGIPYIDDLYLDIIFYPSGKIRMLDEDELKSALNANDITQEEFNFAYKVANELIKKINGKSKEMINFTLNYFKLLRD